MKTNGYYPDGTDLTFAQITHEQERELFAKAKAGDADAKEKLIKLHLLFVANLARGLVKGRLPDDCVVSAANFALLTAFDRFDPAFDNRFAAFLRVHVRGAVAKLWREQNIVSPSDFSDGPVVSVPVNDDVGSEDGAEAQEEKEFLLKLAEQAKAVLDPRERELVDLLFSEVPTNQAEVARKLKLSRERVRQVFNGALEKLKKEMRRLLNLHGINQ